MKPITSAQVAVFRAGIVGFRLGQLANRVKSDTNPDCSGCASAELRDALGFTEAQWQELCGPNGLDCPVIA